MFKLLVVEDDRELNRAVCSFLNQNGYDGIPITQAIYPKLTTIRQNSDTIGKEAATRLVSMHLGGGRATKDSEIDLSVGLVLHKKVGDRVEKGESLATIHASTEEKAQEAAALLRACCTFSDSPVERPAFIKAIIR